jgi:transposase
VLLGISKRGDKYLRTLLIHGARAVVRVADRHEDPLSQWIQRLKERRGVHKAIVAVANKTAPQFWAQLAYGCRDPIDDSYRRLRGSRSRGG